MHLLEPIALLFVEYQSVRHVVTDNQSLWPRPHFRTHPKPLVSSN